MAVRDAEYYDYNLDPETWPEFMRAGFLPAPPSGQMWPDASDAPVNASNAGMPVGLMWPTMPRPPQQAPDPSGTALFMQSGMLPLPSIASAPMLAPDTSTVGAPSAADEASEAQAARDAAARRNGQWGRRGTQEYTPSPQREFDPNDVNVAEDVFKSGGVGLGKGVINTLGTGGDAREGVRSAVNWAASKFATPTLSDLITGNQPRPTAAGDLAVNVLTKVLPPHVAPLFMGPTSEQIQQGVEGVTGEFYKPKTTAGEFAQTGGEFAGALLGNRAGVLRRGAQWLGSTLGAEGAGRLADAFDLPGLVPYARMFGGIAGGALPSAVPRRAAASASPSASHMNVGEEPTASPPSRPAPQMNVIEEPVPPPSPSQGPIGVTLHEQAPGAGTGHLPGVLELPYAERLKYTGNAWNVPGTNRDAIHEALGIRSGNTRPVTGAFEGETNPAHASPMRVNTAGESVAGPAAYEAGEKTRGLFSGQYGVGSQVWFPNAQNEARTSVRIPHQGPFNPANAAELSRGVDPLGFYLTDWGNAVNVVPKPGAGPATGQAVQTLLEGKLGQAIRTELPNASPTREKIVGTLIKGLTGEEAPGEATKAWLEVLNRAPPDKVAALGQSSAVRDLIEGMRGRDANLAGQTVAGVNIGPARADLQHLREVATQGRPQDFIQAVREAYRRNPQAFPAVLLPLIGGPLLYQAGPNRDQL